MAIDQQRVAQPESGSPTDQERQQGGDDESPGQRGTHRSGQRQSGAGCPTRGPSTGALATPKTLIASRPAVTVPISHGRHRTAATTVAPPR